MVIRSLILYLKWYIEFLTSRVKQSTNNSSVTTRLKFRCNPEVPHYTLLSLM